MMAVLLGAGTGLLLVGLAAIVYGLPIKEFSFGSTMILAGVVTACSGAIILGLFVVARQLQNIAWGATAIPPASGRAARPARRYRRLAVQPRPPCRRKRGRRPTGWDCVTR